MSSTSIHIGSCCIGTGRAYIYILYSKVHHALYIGQTNDRLGVIGRLCSHIGTSGTFRLRLSERLGIYLSEIEDLQVFSYQLPDEPHYTELERYYREGVEYLVQKQLYSAEVKLTPYAKIISNVAYNDTVSIPQIKHIAGQIIESFVQAYNRTN